MMDFEAQCDAGYLGVASLNVVNPEDYSLVVGHFNKGREESKETVKKISLMLRVGRCENKSQPLIIAIAAGNIKAESLSKTYDTRTHEPTPATAKISTGACLYVLAGAHRIRATQLASEHLYSDIEGYEAIIKEAEEIDEDYNPNSNAEDNQSTATIQRAAIESSKGLIKVIEKWPVYFYDLGGS